MKISPWMTFETRIYSYDMLICVFITVYDVAYILFDLSSLDERRREIIWDTFYKEKVDNSQIFHIIVRRDRFSRPKLRVGSNQGAATLFWMILSCFRQFLLQSISVGNFVVQYCYGSALVISYCLLYWHARVHCIFNVITGVLKTLIHCWYSLTKP